LPSDGIELEDSFVVESNVHFPTDYNLLWECSRKCLDMIDLFTNKYPSELTGWRKKKDWRRRLKSQMRILGKDCASGGKQKEERMKKEAGKYVDSSRQLSEKLSLSMPALPVHDMEDLSAAILLEQYLLWLNKHIHLVERRLIKGEKIAHDEKMFSIFETYTEWITKGKLRPSVELGKKVSITSDQYQLIIDYEVVDNKTDEALVLDLAVRLTKQYNIQSWSFDKGYWRPVNKELLEDAVYQVIMPKKASRLKKSWKKNRRQTLKNSGINTARLNRILILLNTKDCLVVRTGGNCISNDMSAGRSSPITSAASAGSY
jgi:hypothetical protein